jgi:TolB-like protein
MIVRFGDCALDLERRELRRASAAVHVEPQVFDLLAYLIANRDRVVSRDDIIQEVWSGRIVSDATLSSRINAARQAVGDDGKAQAIIRTVPRRGFRFIAELQGQDSIATAFAQGVAQPQPDPQPASPDRPSIAVLPFINLSGDPEQEYFADGMAEEIITALARIRWLFVIARNSSFTYKGQTVEVKEVGRDLGVRYVLEGSVRKGQGRIRITAQLIEAETGTHLWADRFDGLLEDVFDLQDKVALSVAGVIEPTLEAAEIRRSGRSRANDPTTYDLYLRALSDHLSFEKDRVLRALDLLGQAIEREPRFGPALSVAAWCHVQCDTYGWSHDPQQNRRDGLALAHRALQVADDDPGVIARAAFVVGRFGDDIEGAIALIDRSLQLNPGFAGGWHVSGWLRLFAGHPDLAIKHFLTSSQLSPRGQRMETLTGIGMGHFLAGRFNEAVAVFRISLEQFPHFAQTYRYLAAAYVHLGRIDEAREIVKRLRTITPMVIPPVLPFRNPEHRELCLSGLRLAAEEAA